MNQIRENYPFLKQNIIYLDNASTALKPKCVIDAVTNFYTTYTSNAYRGTYANAEYVSLKIDECRALASVFLNCSSSEIIFTGNCTDSINQLVSMLGIKKEDKVVCSVLEHHSNLLPWVNNASVVMVDTDTNGLIDLDGLENILQKDAIKLVSVTGLSNVTGNIMPIKEICTIAHRYGTLVNIDCCQLAPHKAIDVKDIDCDFLTFSGHKLGGPSGIGILYGKKELLSVCKPARVGGGMVDIIRDFDNIEYKEIPHCFEAGTPAIENILGLSAVLKFYMEIGFEQIEQQNQNLNTYFLDKVMQSNNIELLFPVASIHATIFTFKMRNRDIDMSYFAKILADSANICVSSGYQCCQPLYHKINSKGGMRVSLQFYNTTEEIDSLFEVINHLTI